ENVTDDAADAAAGSDAAGSSAEASEQDEASQPAGSDAVAEEPATDDGVTSDESAPVLPNATEALSFPLRSDSTTFTELITGIPASAASATAEPTSPPTEAIEVFAPLLS